VPEEHIQRQWKAFSISFAGQSGRSNEITKTVYYAYYGFNNTIIYNECQAEYAKSAFILPYFLAKHQLMEIKAFYIT
jgi:hypothetical protein